MHSAAIKDILREIGKTKSRFFSIFAIIAIGAGFFAGLQATCPDMLTTLENYFEEKNLMDIRLVSTFGFDEKDVEAIKETKDVKNVYATYSKDVFVKNDMGENIIAKVMAFPNKGVNEVILVEGRLPENPGECVTGCDIFSIGDTVSVYTTDHEDPISDSLERDSWEVVGKIKSPQYISMNVGSTTIGDGILDAYIMVPEENFCLEVFTEVYVTLESTKGIGAYEDAYSENVDKGVTVFEALAEIRAPERYNEIVSEAMEEINEAKQEIADAEKELADAEKELADAKTELDDALYDLTEAQDDIGDAWDEYHSGMDDYEKGKATFDEEMENALLEISSGKAELDSGKKDYEAGLAQYEAGKAQFENQLSAMMGISPEMLEPAKNAILYKLSTLDPASEEYANAQMQLYAVNQFISAKSDLDAAKAQLDAAKAQIDAGEKSLSEGMQQLQSGKEEGEKELADAKSELDQAYIDISKAHHEINDGWEDYYEGLADYEEGLAEFEEEKAKAEKEIADAKIEIADAEKEIADLEEPKWFVFTRDDNPRYSTYESDVFIIESVGRVFPVFFFLVAMLVCLTTMTRMVEEQRTQIGTMKALGYGKGAIMAKFVVYSAIASITGALFGVLVCAYVFPEIIFSAYAIMYILPNLVHVPQIPVWIAVTLVGLVCTETAVIMACYSELKECPAELMRPKAPKIGKRVLLERVTFIWKRLSFTRKVTIRNLFRYKRRMLMTVLGIAGCAALTLTGFGLYSSISVVIEEQYQNIFHYDLIVALDTDAGEEETKKAITAIEQNEIVKINYPVYMMSADYSGIENISLVVAEKAENLTEMVTLQDRKSKEKFELTEEGVIITERLANIAKLSAGDEFDFYCDGVKLETKVLAVAENYAYHFIYMTEALYENLAGAKPVNNAVFTVMSDTDDKAQETLGEELLEMEGVLALSFSSTAKESFSETVENLNYVIVLIILCAAALAFVVLYNLTNINITERVREIATIKVLGFYDGEVSAYVFRENILLAVMGAAAGLGLGIWLHSFVMDMIQTNDVMFGKGIPIWNYAVAFAMTLLFAMTVNGIMYFRLKKVSMVESLKSVE